MRMLRACFLGLRLYGSLFRDALSRQGRQVAPFTIRRILGLLLLGLPFLVLQALHWTGFLLDGLFFRGYRRVVVRNPVFISGIPRSGTTFVHRSLAAGHRGFTTFSTWEAVLAPSITERMLVRAVARADAWLGAPGRWVMDRVMARWTANDAIHPIRFNEGEEDYLSLLPVGACFILVLLFPSSAAAWRLGRIDQWDAKDRAILLDYYHRCLQRHLFFHGAHKTLLSKNAAFATWLPYLRQRYPDARFMLCVRPPGEALLSNLSSLREALQQIGTAGAAPHFAGAMAATFLHGYACLLAFATSMRNACALVIVDQPTLKAQPTEVLARACAQWGLVLRDTVSKGPSPQKRPSTPVHRHRWFPGAPIPSEFSSQCHPIYEQIRQLSLNANHLEP